MGWISEAFFKNHYIKLICEAIPKILGLMSCILCVVVLTLSYICKGITTILSAAKNIERMLYWYTLNCLLSKQILINM